MDGFDDFGKKLENAGKKLFKKTKEFADTTKLSIKLKDLEIDLEYLYQELVRRHITMRMQKRYLHR